MRHLHLALRFLWKDRFYTTLNTLGLAVGMACCLLAALYVRDELSYDRYHEKGDRIFRVLRESRGLGASEFKTGVPGHVVHTMGQELPELEAVVRGMIYLPSHFSSGEREIKGRLVVADRTALDVFTLPFSAGSSVAAFPAPRSAIITRTFSERFFGSSDPIGKSLTVDSGYAPGEYTVTAVVDVPRQTSLRFDVLTTPNSTIPMIQRAWSDTRPRSEWQPIKAYVLLKPDTNPKIVAEKWNNLARKRWGEAYMDGVEFHLQPITRIRLHSREDYGMQAGLDVQVVYGMVGLAILVVVLAGANFVNLTTARAGNRAREVGVRKALGATRHQLARQFIIESTIVSVGAGCTALWFAHLALPFFNGFTHKSLTILDPPIVTTLLLGATVFGFAAGSYPAFVLSRMHPTRVLSGRFRVGSNALLRRTLTGFQLAATASLLVSSVVLYRQVSFIEGKPLGFDATNLVDLPVGRDVASWQEMKESFLSHPNVTAGAATLSPFGLWTEAQVIRPEGHERQLRIPTLIGDDALLETLGIRQLWGQGLPSRQTADSAQVFLVNEAAVRTLGWDQPIGREITWIRGEQVMRGHVVGVVADFHLSSLRNPIEPVLIVRHDRLFRRFIFRIADNDAPRTISFLEQTWQKWRPNQRFEYAFVTDYVEGREEGTAWVADMMTVLTCLAVAVACSGLFGLIAFISAQRRREIGIRKVFGASETAIVATLLSETLWLTLAACLVGFPVSGYAMTEWLNQFAYRVDLDPQTFLAAAILTLCVALFTTGGNALRAARENPVRILQAN